MSWSPAFERRRNPRVPRLSCRHTKFPIILSAGGGGWELAAEAMETAEADPPPSCTPARRLLLLLLMPEEVRCRDGWGTSASVSTARSSRRPLKECHQAAASSPFVVSPRAAVCRHFREHSSASSTTAHFLMISHASDQLVPLSDASCVSVLISVSLSCSVSVCLCASLCSYASTWRPISVACISVVLVTTIPCEAILRAFLRLQMSRSALILFTIPRG